MRIGGLASGMDIDSLVKDLMKAERIPLDKLSQKKQFMEWQRDDYREINKLLFDFDKMIFDGVMKQGSYIQKNINVSNENVASISNLNSTTDFSGSLTVHATAKAATMQSSSAIVEITDPTKKLSEYTSIGTATQTITIKAIGKDGKLETEGYTLEFDPAKETLNSLMEKINKDSGVNIFYDSATKKVAVTAKYTGNAENTDGTDAAEIVLSGNIFTQLKLDADNNVAGLHNQTGVNADFTFNGLRTERSSNTFAINGVQFNLKGIGETSFSSSPNVDKILDTVVKFVDKYNEIIEKINGEVREKRYRSYQPLTSEQREAMSDKEVEMWEEKARSGTLKGDSVLSGALNKMRVDLYSSVSGLSGKINQLSEIGIKTSKNYLDGGKLIISEEDLKKAISENPNAIYEMFAKDGNTTSEKGLARRLRDSIENTMKSIEEKAGKSYSVNTSFSLGRVLNNLDNQIDRFESRLIQVEDRYWRQFTEMEKAIQRSNEQSMFLMNQFGG
ncbi:flagellar hook-associated protein 2 [Bacillus ectoiniformans]|uniref:flagellar hook-associated protein 2 n=1 Tax=Bacillus ectoiniformans TaxID=1494429 RepID=UPI00195DAD85|nr:flagellar hook-associated protein 2 [Bacillus ectoiniformans]MBM7649375.1 flagellar hook-associated protein 2 [Bacillus ectoiniformans]